MLLSGVVGYFLPSTLTNLGIGQVIYENVPPYAKVIGSLSDTVGGMGLPNPWVNGGLQGIGKTAGILDASRRVLAASKRGHFGRGDLVGTAFDIGLILDAPGDSGGWGGSQNASGGYWVTPPPGVGPWRNM